jgi:hypothetical protein
MPCVVLCSQIKNLYHVLANGLQPRLAAETAVILREDSVVDPNWLTLDLLGRTAARIQSSHLTKASTLLDLVGSTMYMC